MCVYICLVASVVSDSLRPYGPWPARLLCPWGSHGKNTGVGCHFLFQSFQIPFIRDIIHYFSFSVWPTSLSSIAPLILPEALYASIFHLFDFSKEPTQYANEVIKPRLSPRMQNKSNCTHLLWDFKPPSVSILPFFLRETELPLPLHLHKSPHSSRQPVYNSQPPFQLDMATQLSLLNGIWAEGCVQLGL